MVVGREETEARSGVSVLAVEAVVAHAEQAPSLAAAANALRPDPVELPGAMRRVERRVRLVHHVLTIVIGLLPEPLARCIADMGAVRTRLETETALRALRTLVASVSTDAVCFHTTSIRAATARIG